MIDTAVTALFVPGDRADRYAKAAASGADLVIIDLEDAVAPAAKETARDSVVAALRPGGLTALVRVNAIGSSWSGDDLAALAALGADHGLTGHGGHGPAGHGLAGVVVPKAEDPAFLSEVVAATGVPVVALLESAAGVAAARDLAAVPGVARLAFGALDFAYDVGSDVDALTGQVARAQVVIASRAADLPGPLESPSTDLGDPVRIEQTSRAARLLGFSGRLCIHPAQLAPVRAGFAPTAGEIAWARDIVGAGAGVTRIGDQMVDRPVLERARRILHQARTP